MQRFRYPVGRAVFSEIIEEGLRYADKTGYVWDMTHGGAKFVFLSRPRRFGKTLLVSTLEAYFQGRRDLFEGLQIAQLEKDWKCHPVLRLDLSGIKPRSVPELEEGLSSVLEPIEKAWGCEGRQKTFSARMESLVRAAYDATGMGVVLLVDEYDAPLLAAMGAEALLEDFRKLMRTLYAPLKKCEPMLRFVFLTGITKFSQVSIFSELNNLSNISMVPKYAGICGITAEELNEHYGADVEALAEQLGKSAGDTRRALKEKYDGYHFAHVSPDVYNPFSLAQALENGILRSYWFESGTPTSLVQVLKAYDFDIPELGGIEAPSTSFDAPTEQMTSPVPFLYQSGYLTIKGYDPDLDLYTLGIPNGEVDEGLYRTLLPSYVTSDQMAYDSFLAAFLRALRSDDLEAALGQLRSFLAGIPYDLAAKDEKAFQTSLFIVFKLVGSRIESEVRTATGRIDVTIATRTTLYVMELKYGHSAAAALEQIDAKGYLVPYQASGRRLVKAGVNFDPDQRTIGEWIVREA